MYKTYQKILFFLLFCFLSAGSFSENSPFRFILEENTPYAFEITIYSLEEKIDKDRIDDIDGIEAKCKAKSCFTFTITPLKGISKYTGYIELRVDVGKVEGAAPTKTFENLKLISQRTFHFETGRDFTVSTVEYIRSGGSIKNWRLTEAICGDIFFQIFRLNSKNHVFLYKDKPMKKERILPIRKESTVRSMVILDEKDIRKDRKEYNYQIITKRSLTPFHKSNIDIWGNIIVDDQLILEDKRFVTIKNTGIIDTEEMYFFHIKRMKE